MFVEVWLSGLAWKKDAIPVKGISVQKQGAAIRIVTTQVGSLH